MGLCFLGKVTMLLGRTHFLRHYRGLESLRKEFNGRIDSLEQRIESIHSETEARFFALEQKSGSFYEELNGHIDSLEQRIASLPNELNSHIEALDVKIDSLQREIYIPAEFWERLVVIEAKFGISRH
jgi:uncharacterized protein Yka (UPF0111/DUF47 family)